MALNSRMRLRRSASSSVVWVRSPVKTTKSGAEGSALTAATACRSVLAASGLGGPLKPQCESESWTKKKSSSCPPDLRRRLVHAPARPEAKTTPPRPRSCMNSRRPLGSFMSDSFAGMTRPGAAYSRSILRLEAPLLLLVVHLQRAGVADRERREQILEVADLGADADRGRPGLAGLEHGRRQLRAVTGGAP